MSLCFLTTEYQKHDKIILEDQNNRQCMPTWKLIDRRIKSPQFNSQNTNSNERKCMTAGRFVLVNICFTWGCTDV